MCTECHITPSGGSSSHPASRCDYPSPCASPCSHRRPCLAWVTAQGGSAEDEGRMWFGSTSPELSFSLSLDPITCANPAMEEDPQNNTHGHYAPQNRDEMGVAMSKYERQLDAEGFGEILDAYDNKMHLHVLSSIKVPKPVEMLDKLEIQNKKSPEEGLSECCEFLNHLVTLLPSM